MAAPAIEEEEFLDKDEPEVEEPNPAAVGEDWADLALEDPLEALGPSMVAIELSEDPVRLYLKEIGQINLLDATASSAWQRALRPTGISIRLSNHVDRRYIRIATSQMFTDGGARDDHCLGAHAGGCPKHPAGRNP